MNTLSAKSLKIIPVIVCAIAILWILALSALGEEQQNITSLSESIPTDYFVYGGLVFIFVGIGLGNIRGGIVFGLGILMWLVVYARMLQ